MLLPQNVPAAVGPLLPPAELWGIGDDVNRSMKVEAAPDEELRQLLAALDAVGDDVLCGWLSGPDPYLVPPSREYVAVTCLTMTVDQARVLLAKRQSKTR
jgi:hypothetical protein